MHLAIIGTGKMGTAIFQSAVDRDLELTLCSRSAENLRQVEGRFRRKVDRAVRNGEITAEQAETRNARTHFTTRLTDLAPADFVLESVPEVEDVKNGMLRAVEEAVRPEVLILSNTSSLSLNKLAGALRRPERFCGLHFFYPVMVIPLVEIITAKTTGPGVVKRLRELCGVLGRDPIEVADGPGSPLNWVLACLYVEGLYLLEEGAALPDRVDAVARRYFSPGPCEAMDTLGLEIILQILTMLTMTPDGRTTDWLRTDDMELPPAEAAGRSGFHVPWLFHRLHHEQRLGRKASRGLFLYEGSQTLNDEPAFYLRAGRTPRPLADEEIADRLFYTVVNTALHALSRGVCRPADLDRGLKEVLLMRDGPLTMARALGAARVRADLSRLQAAYGTRFRPALALEEAGVI